MNYVEILKKIKEKYENDTFQKSDIKYIAEEVYNIKNEKTIRNIIGILKRNSAIKEVEKDKYILVTKSIYKYKEEYIEKTISKLIKREYIELNFIVWNTRVLNEFTLHYVVNNYIIVEVERIGIDLIINLLKINLPKRYTIITQDILNKYKDLYSNNDNLIIVKPLHTKSPIDVEDGKKKYISIEKVMLDIYVDELYIQYQGKEIKTIYENIFQKYDIDLKRLIKYAEFRTDKNEYIKFINNLDIPEKYKLKEK